MDLSWQHGDRMQLATLLNEVARLLRAAQHRPEDRAGAARARLPGRRAARARVAARAIRGSLQPVPQPERHHQPGRRGTQCADAERDPAGQALRRRQKRLELTERFTARDPSVQTIDAQIAALREDSAPSSSASGACRSCSRTRCACSATSRSTPTSTWRCSTARCRCGSGARAASAAMRVLDPALQPEKPIRPRAAIAMGLALVAGLFGGPGRGAAAPLVARHGREPGRDRGPHRPRGLQHGGAEPAPAPARPRGAARPARRARAGDAAPRRPGARGRAPAAHRASSSRCRARATTASWCRAPRPAPARASCRPIWRSCSPPAAGRVLLIDADLRRSSLGAVLRTGAAGTARRSCCSARSTNGPAIHRAVLPQLDVMASGVPPRDRHPACCAAMPSRGCWSGSRSATTR